jgi:Flp pilus assembly protein TadD
MNQFRRSRRERSSSALFGSVVLDEGRRVAKHPPPVNSRQHQALERANLALRMGRFAEAEQLAAEVLKASRTDAAAVAMLAQALIAQNRGDEAISPLEKVVRRGNDSGLETLLGAALGSAGRREEAIEQLRRTAARRPPFAPAIQELAGQLSKAGRIDEAIAAIESGLAVLPENIDLQLNLASLYLLRNKRDRARAILSKARDMAPGRPDVFTALARVLLLDGEFAAAEDGFRRALGLRPDDALARADLATCLLEMGKRDAGEANLRQAFRGRPQMLGRATYALVQSSHGRFFFRQSAVAKFLQDEPTTATAAPTPGTDAGKLQPRD